MEGTPITPKTPIGVSVLLLQQPFRVGVGVVRVKLTAEQSEQVSRVWEASRNYCGSPHTVVGELRREIYPAGDALFIQFTAVPAAIADAMRLAYTKAVKNRQAKEVTPKVDLTDAN